ncbi:hypothetical protein MYX77_00130 [Acidobacteriia bacterium AH_259_A11_L15]|nr:hypothetical protein [Acidobacteriia bacterium AH_259_A11_L15]
MPVAEVARGYPERGRHRPFDSAPFGSAPFGSAQGKQGKRDAGAARRCHPR